MSKNARDAGYAWSPVRPNAWNLRRELSAYGVHPARYTGARLHRLWNLFLLLPRTGRDHRLPHQGQSERHLRWRKEANMRQLCKGNVAVVKGAILAGCRAYYGYPITPASEIAEAAALYFPQVGGTFLQAESEIAAINMVYGAAAAGVRVDEWFLGTRPQPDAGRHVIPGRRGTALRDRRCHARRTGAGQHRARTERLLRHGQGRRPWQLPQHRVWLPRRCRRWPT